MKTRIFNLLILDESGSMHSIYNQALSTLNETLQSARAAQKNFEGQEHFVSIVTFNSEKISTILNCVDAEKTEDITPSQYNPNACTPLYDAIGKAVHDLMPHVSVDDKVLVTIITDGYENSSREYTADSVKKLTEMLEKKGWTFVYIGANQDAAKVSHGLGIRNSLNFVATELGTSEMNDCLYERRKAWYKRVDDARNDCDGDGEHLTRGFFENE